MKSVHRKKTLYREVPEIRAALEEASKRTEAGNPISMGMGFYADMHWHRKELGFDQETSVDTLKMGIFGYWNGHPIHIIQNSAKWPRETTHDGPRPLTSEGEWQI